MRTPEANANFGLLLDFYGELLTARQRELIAYYYNDDLSLAEIADLAGITRQGVRDGIKKSEALLSHYEQTLGLVARFRLVDEGLREVLDAIAKQHPDDAALAALVAKGRSLLDFA